ncbi:hypothetical protein G6F32_014670 [Rhizopus arrhizus]|nr:hypothetical protein G6F32_014670 [Rhizopus arrhizus]
MNVNIKSAFFISQAAGRHFIEQGHGKIINIASMLSFQGGIRVPSQGREHQRPRAGLHGNGQHRPAARRPGPQQGHPRPHPGRPLGYPGRPGRCGRVPGVVGVGLHQRCGAAGGWWLAGALPRGRG